MTTSKKPMLVCDGAARWLEETLVRSLEGTLFALVSALFALASIALVADEKPWGSSGAQTIAATAPGPAAHARAEVAPRQIVAARRDAGERATQ
ncbi:MAG: hypothetical protein HYZ20_13215 [Burkholderiales bacterium]|nr:hypothetical protein [Burkholderiales bacterium]